MIVRERPSAIRLFFALRGSVFPRVKWHILTVISIAAAVTAAHGRIFNEKITLTPIPFSLIGLALAIFLGFRNTASYDRWWEGRRLWGEFVLRARSLTRLLLTHVQPATGGKAAMAETSVRRLIAFGYALKHRLRGTEDDESGCFLSVEDAAGMRASPNPPDALLRQISRDLARVSAQGRIDPMMACEIEKNLTALTQVQAGSERIRSTPLPFSYTLLLHRTAHLYCLMLPFGLVDTVGVLTPLVVGLISYTFFGLDALGDEIEEPFGQLPNDLPLTALCRAVEIDLKSALGETNLPPMKVPVEHCLM